MTQANTFFLICSLLLCASVSAQTGQSSLFFPQSQVSNSRPSWNCGYVLLDDSSQLGTGMQLPDPKQKVSPLFQVHGNIYYDYYYRSNIDTPYVLNDYQQHTIRTYLDVTYKDNYPVRIAFTARINNAGFLKNMVGANFQFNNHQFENNVKTKLLDWLNNQKINSSKLKNLEDEIAKKRKALQELNSPRQFSSPQQDIIENREQAWLAKNSHQSKKPSAPGLIPSGQQLKDSVKNYSDSLISNILADSLIKHADSIASVMKQKWEKDKQTYDSLNRQLGKLEKEYQALTDKATSSNKNLINAVKTAPNNQQLSGLIEESGIPDSLLPAGYKNLLAIKSFGIGRTVVDYSELSAKNITINGIEAEYNPRNYYAIAAGMIDYRYRDLILNNPDRQKQYLTIGRIGKGRLDGNNIIFTWYQGKKQLYNYVTSTNDSVKSPDFHLTGFTLEGHYKLNNTTLLTAEAAKSASPYYNRSVAGKSLMASNLSFSDHSNEAYSLKISSYLPHTATRVAASYQKIGANFQSFSLFNTSSRQSLWSARVDQPFFKRQLTVTASIRTNDFSNPYIDNNYYSNTVFKSIQATLRMKKLPVISVGYFPSSQLTKVSDDHYIESLFYTLTAYVSHFYRFHDTRMNTFLSYTRFYNRQADSGFVYFNTKNVMLSHTVFFSRFSLSGNGTAAINNEYSLYTAGAGLQMQVRKWFSLKGGMKYNYQTEFNNRQIGYNFGSTLKIAKLGELQMYVEKGFIPGVNKQLLPNNTGRFSYYKVF